MKIKLIDVLNAARKLAAAYRQWNEQDGPIRLWNGGPTKCLSEELDSIIRETCDATADHNCEVDPRARGLLLVFDDIAYYFLKWIQDASMQLVTAPPRGSSELHTSLQRLEEQLKSLNLPRPQPIGQLVAGKVSPNQIAIIYGWKAEDGSPDTTKVHEEIEKPGTHYNPESWQHPALRVIQAEIDRNWQNREPRGRSFAAMEPTAPTAVAIPTLDELFAAKAPVAQIMRLHKMAQEEVEFEASERGMSLVEDRFIMPANTAVAHQELIAANEKREADMAAAR